MESKTKKASGVPEAQLIIDLTETDLPIGTPVYIYIIGLVKATYRTFYYIDNNGLPQIMKATDNSIAKNTFPGMKSLNDAAQNAIIPNYPNDWADYSIPVEVGSNLILNLGSINTDNIPTLGTGTAAFSGRIYFSVGVPKLPFTADKADAGYVAPVYGNGSGMPGSLTLYDWIEFSYDSEGNFNGNTTQVNQFGLPLTLIGTSTNGKTYPSQGILNTSRNTILNNINNEEAPFGNKGVIVPVPKDAASAYPKDINYLRAVSPVTTSGAPANSYYNSMDKYFDTDIKKAYTKWQSTPLVTYDTSTDYYTGVVFPVKDNTITAPTGYPEGSLAFYKGKYSTMEDLASAIKNSSLEPEFYLTGSSSNVITSNDIWQCANSLATGGTAQKNVGKIIGAAFNRGIVVSASGAILTSLEDGTCSNLISTFYSKGTLYNKWAKWFHEYNSNGLAYAFSYDDVCDQNPSIPPSGSTLVASFIRIELGKFYS